MAAGRGVEADRGEWVDPTAGAVTFGEWSDVGSRGCTGSSRRRSPAMSRSSLPGTPRLRRGRAGRISTPAVGSGRRDDRGGPVPARVRQARQVLSRCARGGRRRRADRPEPCDRVKPPTVRKRRQLFLTAVQVSKLAEAAESRQEGAGSARFAPGLLRAALGRSCGAPTGRAWTPRGAGSRSESSATEIAGRLDGGPRRPTRYGP